jgi:hypothetical protein
MNWKLVFQLSLFGLAMGIATVFFIPSSIEPIFWLAIFGICAHRIATRCRSRFFAHGFLVSLLNSVWITTAHVLLFDSYIANHPEEAAMIASMPLAGSPRLMMAATGPAIGALSGLVLGLFAVVAHKLITSRAGGPAVTH